MRRRRLVFAFAVAAVLPAAAALADGGGRYMATGGGQLVLEQNQIGPGTTVALEARQLEPGRDAAEGVVQEVDHAHGSTYNGRVFCMHVEGHIAVIAYRARIANDATDPINQLIVYDNGEGPLDDVIAREVDVQNPELVCAVHTTTDNPILGRGNVQITQVN